MDKKILNSMFDNLLHIGNKSNYWNPKMKDYIYGTVNGIHVINLVKTGEKIEEVKKEIRDLHAEGKKILFVATKLQTRDAFAKLAQDTGHFYVTEKWVPGLLTNFKTIKKRIATYLRLLKDSESGALDVLTKKEKAAKMLELEKLDRAFKGLKEMKKIPDVIFAIDGVFEKQAVKEANSLNLPAYAIMNTNGDETVVQNLIPANTNSVKSIDFIAKIITESLAGVKVKATVVRKFDAKRVSGEKRTPTKTAPIKKEVVAEKKAPAKKEEVKTEETK
ncbi:30S ribosomal protein S2 [Candidatus Gracilibacteria bacterium 28_42_T64]|nr:30S ribosomal protein S2 [Candidatus Gracilibacteria bacterium 28_42_T64]